MCASVQVTQTHSGGHMYVLYMRKLTPLCHLLPLIEQSPHANFDAVAGGAYELWPKRHEVGITYVK